MKLYHWTQPKNLVGIAAGGLEPHPHEIPYITAGHSVVWLTANPSRDLTPADIKHLSTYTPEWETPWQFGRADDVRLTVKFNSTNQRKLYRWVDWIAQRTMLNRETGAQYPLARLTETFPPSARDYWIYLKRIPASQIELPPITARVAMLGLKADSEPYKQLATVPPDTIIRVAA